MDTLERVVPDTSQVTIPFTWMPVSEIWGKCSVDFFDGITAENLAEKRQDEQYPRLLEDIRINGVRWPITYTRGTFGNGHHRLAACVELGYTHIPVQENQYEEYSYMEDERDSEWYDH